MRRNIYDECQGIHHHQVNKIVPASTKIKLTNGEEIDLLMNFRGLSLLRKENKSVYEKLNKFIFSVGDLKDMDLLEIVEMLYACYQMHQLYYQQEISKTYEEFLELVEFDLEKLMNTYTLLLVGDKKKASQKLLKEKPIEQKEA